MPSSQIKSASLENSARDSGKKELYPKSAKQDNHPVFAKRDAFLEGLLSSVSWSPDRIQEPYAWAGHMPFAYWLMTESQPKIFVELGTHTGNSYFSFCQAVRDNGLISRCYAVDTWKGDEQAGFYGDHVYELVNGHNESQYKSFSTLYRMTFDEALAQFQDQSVDLLHIDGLHTYQAVRHDFESWLPKLAPGALVLFHDIKVSHGEFGVWRFWAELKEKYPQNFEFRHSHGLGLIRLPGSTRAGDLVWLREGTAEKKNLLEVMSSNGESLMAKVRHKELERLASAAQTKANKPAIGKPLNLEVFFAQEGEKFSEEKKISEPVLYRENEHSQIRIQLQGKATRSVLWRIDLGDQPDLFRVHELGFTGENGKKIWRLTDHSDEAVIGGSAERLSGDGFSVCSFGKDPQILLPKLSLSSDDKLYEIRITLEVLNAKDCLPFLATRYHELESQSRSNFATLKAALEQKEEEARKAQSKAEKLESLEKNISNSIEELKSQQKLNLLDQTLFKGLIVELKETREKEAKKGQELRQEMEAQKVATAKEAKELGDSLAGLKQELEAQKVATSKGVKELGDSLGGLKQELIHELRTLTDGLNESQERSRQKNLAQMDDLRTCLLDRQRESENNLLELAKYAEKIQDSVVAPSSYLIPAPFSWYSYLYKMLHIKKPVMLNKISGAAPKRPGFWRRLERSIRKGRKKVQLMCSRLFFDENWYLKNNVDVEKSDMNAWEHYTQFGRAEGRFGSRLAYLSRYQLSMKLWTLLQDNWFFAKIPRLQRELIKYLLIKKRAIHFNSLDKKTHYQHWWRLRAYFDLNEIVQIKKAFSEKSAKPIISVLLPIFNPDPMLLKKAITSVLRQSYPYWELCIADDKSTDPEIKRIINFYSAQENRIKVIFREKNGHISRASNSALELAKGEYIALLDHDDELAKDALLWVANELQNYPNACLVYSDEDKIDRQGERHEPYFKPDFNWILFWSQNLITHLAVLKTSVVKELGGFRVGYEGSQDYDLFLRVVEQVGSERIRHIPRVLYHWRKHNLSTAASGGAKPYALVASVKAVNESLARQGISGKVEPQESLGCHRFYGLFKEKKPRCSVIIPTRNAGDLVTVCVESIFKITDYPDIEVILVDNESDDQKSLRAFEALRKRFRERFRILPCPGSFNFSGINNHAVQFASGPLLCLLNNDTEVLNAEWMSEMAWFASRREIGAVGAKLLYPSGEIQHAGVVLGIGGVAGHAFCHAPGNASCYFNRAIIPSEFSAVTAACLMVEKKKYLEVDGLDETNLKVAFNDTDFCLKLRARGYRNVLNPNAILRHHESKTRGFEDNPQKVTRFNDEINTMKDRWQENLRNDPCYNPNLTLEGQDFSLESINEMWVKYKEKNSIELMQKNKKPI